MTVNKSGVPLGSRAETMMQGGRWIAFAGFVYVVAWIIGLAIGQITSAHGSSGQPPQVTIARDLPRAASVYSVLVWPAIWGVTEEATYVGYVLPRLKLLTGNTPVAVALVSVVWALQHEPLPLLFDRRYLVYRPLSALPITLTMPLLSLLQGQRLLSLILPHWASNAATALFAAQLQALARGKA